MPVNGIKTFSIFLVYLVFNYLQEMNARCEHENLFRWKLSLGEQ